MRRVVLGGVALLGFATAACGGGGSSGSGSPAPTPAPSVAPVPTPTPTPSPAQALNTAGTPCFAVMYPAADRLPSQIAGGAFCGRDGRFGPGVTPISYDGYGSVRIEQFNDYFVDVVGIEPAGATYIRFTAPKGSTVFSPVTSLLAYVGDQAAVKQALGLDIGAFALAVDRELTTFNPVTALASDDPTTHADGERLLAANLRVLAATIPFSGTSTYFPSFPVYQELGNWIGANRGFLFNDEGMSRYLTSRLSSTYDAKVISAMAHLINTYARVIPVRLMDEGTDRQMMLGIHGFLDLEIRRLLVGNSSVAADAVLPLSIFQVTAATQIFHDAPPFPTTGNFFPSPNFVETSGNSLIVQADQAASGGANESLVSNDLFARNTAQGGAGFFPGNSVVTGVTVPATYASSISAVLGTNAGGNTITISALAGFRGRVWFDYSVQHPTGQTGIGRVFVNFR